MSTITRPPEARTAPAPITRRTGTYKGRLNRSAYAMLAPGLIIFFLFILLPIGYTLYLSFQRIERKGLGLGEGGVEVVFAGLSNYTRVLANPEFLASSGRALIFAILLVPTVMVLALLFALSLDTRRVRGGGAFRLLIFLPFAVPAVIGSLMWAFLYIPAMSPIYQVFDLVGWTDVPSLLSGNLVMFAIVNIGFWGGVGFNMTVLYTSLRAIPTDIYEAARIDGASEVQIALRIKIPAITPALVMTTLFAVIAVLQVYGEPTTLKPLRSAISSTWSPLMFVYRLAFTEGDIYAGSAASIVIALITLVLSFVALRAVQRRAFAQED